LASILERYKWNFKKKKLFKNTFTQAHYFYSESIRLYCEIPCAYHRSSKDTTLCDKVCQWLAAGPWFSLGTQISSINNTDSHDITEILLNINLLHIYTAEQFGTLHWCNYVVHIECYPYRHAVYRVGFFFCLLFYCISEQTIRMVKYAYVCEWFSQINTVKIYFALFINSAEQFGTLHWCNYVVHIECYPYRHAVFE
jgi:hypothetical protein